MDPLTAGLWVGASLLTSLSANRSQAKIEAAQVKMETENARLQAAEAAYERTKSFRQNMSANLALSGMGKGGVTGFRGIAAESISNYFQDIQSLTTQDLFAQVSGSVGRAINRSNKLKRDVSSLESAASLAEKLQLFKGGK
jgi:hypothetical protein